MCSQGELQRHQAAAHCPVTGPDEEAEEHTRRRLFYVLHEAATKVAVDMIDCCRRSVGDSVGHTVKSNTDARLTSLLFVKLFTQCFHLEVQFSQYPRSS